MSQIDRRIKVNTIIENQLPEFLLSDFPNAVEFFKQYYISQEFQGGPSDLIGNFDQYLKVDNLVPEVVVGSTNITSEILVCNSIDGFNKLIEAHELIISKLISKKTIKDVLFKDFDGSIKSLGAWGGDMIMVTSHNNPSGYFKERGYSTIFKFEELLI